MDGVSVTSPYGERGAQQISADGKIAYATVSLAVDIDMTESTEIGQTIADQAPALDGLQVEVGGQALAPFEPPQSELDRPRVRDRRADPRLRLGAGDGPADRRGARGRRRWAPA